MTTRRTLLAGLTGATTLTATGMFTAPTAQAAARATVPARGTSARPLVVAHRGASGYRPEHTLAAYQLAAHLGADVVEPDLVATKDGHLVCRHEPEISGTTDVADRPEFADRRRTVDLDGTATTGWFTVDFTLAELRTLRAVERLPAVRQHNTLWDGRYRVPTFDEVLTLRADLSEDLGRTIGVYPETKHPTFFAALGLDLEPLLLAALRRHGLNRPGAPVHVQSFETANLRRLRSLGLRTRAVQLLSATGAPYDVVAAGGTTTYADLTTPDGLADVARYAQGIGPDKSLVVPRTAAGALDTPTALVGDAHDAGLVVHPYTFRAENTFLPTDLRNGTAADDLGDAVAEITAFLEAGVDGFFTDQPDIGVLARDTYLS